MKALLTGSRVYGTPHGKSDVDLVICCTEEEAEILVEFVAPTKYSPEERDWGLIEKNAPSCPEAAYSITVGNLNLIIETDPDQFAIWKEGTRRLKRKAPVTREEAVKLFRKLRKGAR